MLASRSVSGPGSPLSNLQHVNQDRGSLGLGRRRGVPVAKIVIQCIMSRQSLAAILTIVSTLVCCNSIPKSLPVGDEIPGDARSRFSSGFSPNKLNFPLVCHSPIPRFCSYYFFQQVLTGIIIYCFKLCSIL